MSELSVMKGAKYGVTPPKVRKDDVLHHFGRRKGVEAPVVHRREGQLVLALQGELPVRLQLGVPSRGRSLPPVPSAVGFPGRAEAQLQARDSHRSGHGAFAGLDAHHPEVCGDGLNALDEVPQRVEYHQQVVYIGLDEAPLGLSRRARAVPLGPVWGLQDERMQQGAFGVALPDAAQHVNRLCQPVCGGDAQSGGRVEEKQQVNDLRRHGEVAQDEVECAVRGGVKGLAGVKGEDVVGFPPLELPLRHEQGGGGVGAREGPLLPNAGHAVLREHLRDPLREGAREQLHVQLAQGYGPVVVQFGGARDFGAEPDVRISPVHRRRGAAEDGPLGVHEEPLDGRREGLDEAGLHVVGARCLAIDLVQRGP